MSDSEKISLTFKEGTGFDASWVVFHADSVDEASAILQEFRTRGGFGSVKTAANEFRAAVPQSHQEAVQTVQAYMPGSQPVAQENPAQGQQYAPQGQQLPQQYQQQPEFCPHGRMEYVANGKYGPFWGCPLPRGDQNKCKTRSAS